MPLDDALGGVARPTRDEGTVTRGWDTGGVTDLILDSLQRRMRALHSLYYDAVDTMTLDHVNHFEREGVVPIAFCLFHITNMIDASFLAMTGTTPIWNDEWRRSGEDDDQRPRQAPHRRRDGRPADRRLRRVPGVPCGRCFARTEAWLDDARSGRAHPSRDHRGPSRRRSRAPTAPGSPGPDGITLLDATECWIYQHGLRHMGEIELARGLVGLQGMTS